jgi:hypothetical protein
VGLASLRNQTFNKFLTDIPMKIDQFSSLFNTTKPFLQQASTSTPVSLNNNLNTNKKSKQAALAYQLIVFIGLNYE